MPFGLYKAAAALNLPDFNISERLGGFTTRPAQNFPVGAGLTVPQAQKAGQVLGVRNSFPVSNSGVQQYQKPIGPTAPVSRTVSQGYNPTSVVATPRVAATQKAQQVASAKAGGTYNPEDAYAKQIADLYSNTTNFLSNQRNNLLGSQDSILGAVSSQFDAQRPFLDQARDELMNLNRQQVDATKVQERNALNEANALYNELGQANRQRYGGTSSAGEFAGAIQGRELQRGQNRIYNTTQQNLGTLQQQAVSIEQNYQSQLQQLEAQKQAAIAEARQQFQARVDQIDSVRAATEDAKTQAKLQLLQEFNNRARELENLKIQMQSQIESQTLAAAQNVYSAIQAYRAEQGQPVDLAALPGAQFSQILGGTQSAVDTLFPTGSIRRPNTDEQFIPQGLFFRPEDQLAAI